MFNKFLLYFKYSTLLLKRQKLKFILPFFSLLFTALIIMFVLSLTDSAKSFLSLKNKEIIGGDVVFESRNEIDIKKVYEIIDSKPIKESQFLEFQGIINSASNTTTVNFNVVDNNYPLYGSVDLSDGKTYSYLNYNEIIIDKNLIEKLNVKVGEKINYYGKEFTIKAILDKDPSQLIGGFGFLPKVIISLEGFKYINIDKNLLRKENKLKLILDKNVILDENLIRQKSRDNNLQVDFSDSSRGGFLEGLKIVNQFLILVVLLIVLLSCVNIYVGVIYIIKLLKKSFAVLISLGATKRDVSIILFLSLLFIVALSSILGILASNHLFGFLANYININYGILLSITNVKINIFTTLTISLLITLSAFLPSLDSIFRINPKELLFGGDEDLSQDTKIKTRIFISILTLIPILLVSVFLLNDIKLSLIFIGTTISSVLILISLFYFIYKFIYINRVNLPFFIKYIISFKWFDGLFGVISSVSLFIALTSLFSLILIQSSLKEYLSKDLSDNVPSIYILDVQKSQVQSFKESFEKVELFPNVRARIDSIDGLNIENALSNGEVDRELRREFNLTYRKDLLKSEDIESGVWLTSKKGEVSVDKEFADRVNIKLGSKIDFVIQGFRVETVVTSLRKSDTRSGLPFFYFVLNEEDLTKYPATYFGFSYLGKLDLKDRLSNISANFPNISVIDTFEIRELAESIINSLLILILFISLPPTILSLFLIISLLILTFSNRKRVSAQLMSFGATKGFIERLYISESVALTFFVGVTAYFTSILVTFIINNFYLKIKSVVYFDMLILFSFAFIILIIILSAYLLWILDKRQVKDLLNYE